MATAEDVKVGDVVVWISELRVEHDALVTAVWPWGNQGGPPSLNLVFVAKDENKSDNYGRQVERSTSVPHESRQPRFGHPEDKNPIGYCWKLKA